MRHCCRIEIQEDGKLNNLIVSLRTVASMALSVLIVGCGIASANSTPIGSHGGPVRDHVSLVDTLRAQGVTVEPMSQVEQPFLRAKGTVLMLSGGTLKQSGEIQSFNYDDTDLGTNGIKAAEEDASNIQPDGNTRTMMIEWIAPPHFFRKERVIVIYVGSDASTLALLKQVLGAQFAGK